MKRAWGLAAILAAAFLAPACSSDPTTSEPYIELDDKRQDLETTVSELEADLVSIDAELDELLETGDLESVEESAAEAGDPADERDRVASELELLDSELDDLTGKADSLSALVEDLRMQAADLEEMLRQLNDGDFS